MNKFASFLVCCEEFIQIKGVLFCFTIQMTIREKFPFSTQELQNELKHTFWLLDRVDSAKALARKLENAQRTE